MSYKEHFEIPEGWIFMNTPGNGLLPKQLISWRAQREQEFFNPAGSLREQQPAFIQGVRETLANFFGSSAEQVYCTPNFSFGFNVLLDGLPKRCKFLLIEGDYPSLNYPIISRGFSYSSVPLSERLEADIWEQLQLECPDVLAISIVQYITGLKIDLNFIKKVKAAFPSLLIIGDGTQYFGTEPFSFPTSGFDAIGGSGYKWLMAGFGNGFILSNKRLQNILYAEAQQKAKPQEAMWSNKTILHTYFEPGHQDTLSHGSLQQSLRFIENIGLEAIAQQLQATSQYAHAELQKRGLLLDIIANRTNKSAILNIQLDPSCYPFLMAQRIQCFPRGTGIRIGLHIYNDKQDVDRLLQLIDNL